MRLELRLLGRFAASLEGSPPRMVQISAPRRRALLAYLAMQPGYAETRERLADLLWGHRSNRQARQSLRKALAQLRRELEPVAGDVLAIGGGRALRRGDEETRALAHHRAHDRAPRRPLHPGLGAAPAARGPADGVRAAVLGRARAGAPQSVEPMRTPSSIARLASSSAASLAPPI